MPKTKCPYCGRMVGTHLNRWRDEVYNNHKGGRLIERAKKNGGSYVDGDVNKLNDECPGSAEVVGAPVGGKTK